MVGSGLGAGAPFGLDLFAAAAGAIGIFTGAKRLIAPKDQRQRTAAELRPIPR